MADLLLPPNPQPGQTDPLVDIVEASAAVLAGQSVYRHSDTNYRPTEVSATAEEAASAGIALTPAASGEKFVRLYGGSYHDPTAQLTPGETYVVSDGGAISPVGDLTTGDFTTILFVAISTTEATLILSASGVQQ